MSIWREDWQEPIDHFSPRSKNPLEIFQYTEIIDIVTTGSSFLKILERCGVVENEVEMQEEEEEDRTADTESDKAGNYNMK